MAEATSRVDANRNGLSELDPEELARRIRRFATHAHQSLSQPDTSIDDVLRLRRQVRVLLRRTRGLRATGIQRWLQAAQRAIEAALPRCLKRKRGTGAA
jgi:hypothetical protein